MSEHSASSSVSEDSMPPREVEYTVGTEVEVPDTDGGLFKKVLVEGTGSRPVKGAKARVHYVGTLEDGTKFDSSRDRNEPFEFTLGKGEVIKGWDKGVATMRVGEKAVLRCSPDYGYGAAGSPPTIPANATLYFEVELIDWTRLTDISAAKDRSLMKDLLVDGVDYEHPSFESSVTLDLAIYLGKCDVRQADHGLSPLWQKSNWTIEIGETALPGQLEACLTSMRKNEVAGFHVDAALVPAAEPAFNIPSAEDRGKADLTYRVAVHDLSSVKSWSFHGKEKITEGLKRKDKGNAALQKGNPALAERFYRRALEFVGEDYGVSEEDKADNAKARAAVMGNLAQVLLLQHKYSDAASYSNKVLEIDHGNCKALYRLAKAQDAMQNWDEARQTLTKLLSLDPQNADAKALKAHIHAAQKAYDDKQKGMFKKMFAA